MRYLFQAAVSFVFALWWAQISVPAGDAARPDLVREVLAGKRHVARASWWGFDAQDSTAFLQNAIRSQVKKLIIDQRESPWLTRPLHGVSNQEIVFEAGTELAALPGAFHPAGDCLLTFQACSNVVLRGESRRLPRPRLRMRKADYQSRAYEPSEWRHGLQFISCRQVLVQDLAIEQTGGDGIYLGTVFDHTPNLNVVIRRVDCRDNHRQGISVISAENLLIEACLLRQTAGTAPQSGIDFEPNDPRDSLIHCVVRRCLAEGNAGTGYQICPQYLNRHSKPLSIDLENCVSRHNQQHGIHLCGNPQDPPNGRLRITRFTSANDAMAGLATQFNPCAAVRLEMRDSAIRGAAQKDAFFTPIYLQGIGSATRPLGNIRFQNVTIQDDRDRAFIWLRDGKGMIPRDITGKIILERHGHRKTITLDEARLAEWSHPPAAKP